MRSAALTLAALLLPARAAAELVDDPFAWHRAPEAQRPQPAENAAPLPAPRLLTLRNGLRVVLAPDPLANSTRYELRVRVGGRDSPAQHQGLAHLLEHLFYANGTGVGGREYFTTLRTLDAEDSNGFTSEDATRYVVTVPEAQVPPLLWLESRRMARSPALWTAAMVEREVRVVRLEARERERGNPLFDLLAESYRALYPPGHPYREAREPEADLDRLDLPGVQWFWQRHYAPSQMLVSLVGGALPATLEPALERYFGALPVPPPVPAAGPAPSLAVAPGPRWLELNRRVSRGVVLLAWHTPAWLAPGDAAWDLLADLLECPLPGSLARTLTIDAPRASALYVSQRSRELGSLFLVVAQQGRETNVPELERLLLAQLDSRDLDALLHAGFEGVRARRLSALRGLRGDLSARAQLLGSFAALRGSADAEAQESARYAAVTEQELRALLATLRRGPDLRVNLLRGGSP